jgi:phage shock protein B
MTYLSLIALLIVLVPLVVVALLAAVVVGLLRSVTGRSVRRNPRQEAEEARIMQELHHGMARIEDRVENLETIILEREGHKTDTPVE